MNIQPGGRRLAQSHISIRVPWHEARWDGTVCKHPGDNAACLVLKNVTINKDVEAESRKGVAGAHWADLETDQLPPCVNERGGFMSGKPYYKEMVHPYAEFSPIHAHFRPTLLTFPSYAAPCIPYLWMLREGAEQKAAEFDLGFDTDLEDRAVEGIKYKTAKTWVQTKHNQLVQLDTFFSAIRPERSLCFFYAKQVPEIENGRRVLIGVGRVTKVSPSFEYEYGAAGDHQAMGSGTIRASLHSARRKRWVPVPVSRTFEESCRSTRSRAGALLRICARFGLGRVFLWIGACFARFGDCDITRGFACAGADGGDSLGSVGAASRLD